MVFGSTTYRDFSPHFPNHVKIDVDGIEEGIIAGAEKTLGDPRLKSLAVELDEAQTGPTGRTVAAIEAGGLGFVGRRHSALLDAGPFATL